MEELKVGDVIIPTYINDEWLAQYINHPCTVVKIDNRFLKEYHREDLIVTVIPYRDSYFEFELFSGCDTWRVKEGM